MSTQPVADGATVEIDLDAMPARLRARLLLALALGLTLVAAGVHHYLSRPNRWPSVQGTVLESHYLDTRAEHGGPYVHYAYEVDGRRFTSKRLSQFVAPSRYSSDRTHPESVVIPFLAAHPEGSAIDVRYDPDDPDTAVVLWTMNVPGVWVAAAILLCLWLATGWAWLQLWSGAATPPERSRAPQRDPGADDERRAAPSDGSCWRQQYVRAPERIDEPAPR